MAAGLAVSLTSARHASRLHGVVKLVLFLCLLPRWLASLFRCSKIAEAEAAVTGVCLSAVFVNGKRLLVAVVC